MSARVYRDVLLRYKHKPVYTALMHHNVGVMYLSTGKLREALDAFAEVERSGSTLFTSNLSLAATNGWGFFKNPVSGRLDCGYTATKSASGDSIISVPSTTSPPNSTRCSVNFTVRWSAGATGATPIRLERLVGAKWTEITSWPLQEPFYEIRTVGFASGAATARSLRSYSFDIGGAGGGTPTDALRFIYGAGDPGSFELLDAYTSCRYGSLLQ
jgi:hypothetical protein